MNSSLLDLDSILQDFRSNDQRLRERGMLQLRDLRDDQLTCDDQLRLLHAAADPLIAGARNKFDACECLVRAAAKRPQSKLIPAVVELFGAYSDEGKLVAQSILTRQDSREAAEALMDIVGEHAESGDLPRLMIDPLFNLPCNVDVFFPELLRYATIPELSNDIYRLCVAYCDKGQLRAETFAPFTRQILEAYSALSDQLWPAQQESGLAWMWEAEYSKIRFPAGLLLDLMRFLSDARLEDHLQQALSFRDPRLKCFAVLSLLARRIDVDPHHLVAVAESAEMRNWFFELLKQSGNELLYPQEFSTQPAFAESDMVQWLVYPTELGRVPDEIELMKTVSVDTELPGGIYDYYLFRFRTHAPHWAAKKGWMAGVSGPFLKGRPSPHGRGETFSEFKKWDSLTPEEHVGDLDELKLHWRKVHSHKLEIQD